ncbi:MULTISPECIES: SGNH/GDSL hydrolase family protein [unclassified Streptomyces]|uniref:SGNH/GDSL hydrolase family protein n=1 Tax=unclassified Streptomyces TaxID=2593676 RepID=UPI00278C5FCE|nr:MULTISPECIES: SGNH/GDSL hydrolase family protein [unclassified Streptomyces]
MTVSAREESVREVDDPSCLSEAEARRLVAPSPWRRLVVIGDGAAGGAAEPVEGFGRRPWADRVADVLRAERPGLAYINLGRRDLRVAEVRARQLARALALKPTLAVIACGGTDVLGDSFDAYAVEIELSRMIGPLRETGCAVLTMGVPDMSRAEGAPASRMAEVRYRVRLLAERTESISLRHGAHYVDLARRPVSPGPSPWSPNAPYLNGRGHAIAASAVIRILGLLKSRS